MTKWPVQKLQTEQQKHVEQQCARYYLEKPIFFVFRIVHFLFYFFFIISYETLTNIRIYLENNICVQNLGDYFLKCNYKTV